MKIQDKLYQDVVHARKNGNMKAGIPTGATRALEEELARVLSKNTKWTDICKVYEVHNERQT